MIRTILAVAAAIALSGCVTVQDYPNTRPMTATTLQTVNKAEVVVAESNNGIEKSWFMTDSSAAGAPYGLLGALVTGVMDAIMNAGPSRRAGEAADEIAELVPADALTASLVQHLRAQVPADGANAGAFSFAAVSQVQKLTSPDMRDGAIEVATRYTLSEDASAFRITANVTFEGKALPYKTPYEHKKSVPKTELTGPVYRNTFIYHSAQLPVPVMSPDLVERLVANIKDSYKDANGALPAANTDDGKALAKELEKANDDELTKDEIAIFLTREWLKDGGALLKKEVENSHEFVARYLLQDLNSTAVPSFQGTDQLVETQADHRVVRRIGAGLDAGSYVSAPGDMTSFTTYGNAIAIADVQTEKISTLRKRASATKQKNGKKKTTA